MIPSVLIIGAGPSGLYVATTLVQAGFAVSLADQMPSAGRKFLVAGRGGLNLTHSEELPRFITRYGKDEISQVRWSSLIHDFSPAHLRQWVQDLGIETFVGTSGRVFPTAKQAGPLLRRWILQLRQAGVQFYFRHRWLGLKPSQRGDDYEVLFSTPEGEQTWQTSKLVLALGGASWPQTGSTGTWVQILDEHGIHIIPLQPANCGYEIPWTEEFLQRAEGQPLKNIVVRAGEKTVAGELLVTRYGVEGGAIYQLGAELRTMEQPRIVVDLKPSATEEQLLLRLGMAPFSLRHAMRCWKLSPAAAALLKYVGPITTAKELAQRAKALTLNLTGPRSLAEAISTAGGVAWSELDEHLQLKKLPGVYCAGEMVDWTAPTGGYLLQGCFATASRVAQGIRSSVPN